MKTILLLSFLFSSCFLSAQCKVETNKTDSSTAYTTSVRWLACENMSSCSSVEFSKNIIGDSTYYMISINHAIDAARAMICRPTDPLIFNFEDGSSLKLFPFTTYTGVLTNDATGNHTNYIGIYHATKEQFEILKTKKLVGMELHYQSGTINMKVKEKKSLEAQQAIECVIKTSPSQN